MKAYKVTISGTYRGNENEVFDYDKVTGFVPYTDEEIATMHVRGRYAQMWIAKDDRYKNRVVGLRQTWIDSIEVVDNHSFAFEGKDIKEMSQEELQDLATLKDLRAIPLIKTTSLREMQTKAYIEYANKIQMQNLNANVEGFNFAKLPPIVVNNDVRMNLEKKITNEEMIELESKGDIRTTLTRKELEQIAEKKNVVYHPNISDENLYKRLFTA